MTIDGASDAAELTLLAGRLDSVERRLGTAEDAIQDLASALDIINLPEPIATPLARERSATSFHSRFFNLLDAGEACVKYTVAMVLSLAAVQGVSVATAIGTLSNKPSLGTWSAVGKELLTQLADDGSRPARELISSLLKANAKPTSAHRFLFDELVNVRNVERGHGSTQSEGIYETLWLRYRSSVHDTLASCTYLKLALTRVEEVDFEEENPTYRLRVLMGPSPLGHIELATSSAKVRSGTTCVWDREHLLLPLRGLVSFRNCDCGIDHTFFLEESAQGKRRYHSYAANHRVEEDTD